MQRGLYAFGSNGSGQLGLGHRQDVSVISPCIFERGPELTDALLGRPTKIAAGGNHTLLLFSSGVILASGVNSNGRCAIGAGHERDKFSTIFRQALSPHDDGASCDLFTGCTATWEASILVTGSQQVFACGTGSKGELGLGVSLQTTICPQLLPGFPPSGTRVIDLAACIGHVVVVLSDGSAYGWGNGRKGQLGETFGTIWRPRKIEGVPFEVRRAVCGREFTYLVGDSIRGEHMILGSDKWGVITNAPKNISGWKDVGAGWGNIIVLFENYSITAWGRNDHGQLGPSNVSPLTSIAVGSEHLIACTTNGDVLSWGWGEHGNCGPAVDEAGDAKSRDIARVFDSQASTTMIGAGCATSWIWLQDTVPNCQE